MAELSSQAPRRHMQANKRRHPKAKPRKRFWSFIRKPVSYTHLDVYKRQPMQSEREMDDNTCYRGSDLLFDTILEPTAQSALDVAKLKPFYIFDSF